jgi:putative flippase GtrA
MEIYGTFRKAFIPTYCIVGMVAVGVRMVVFVCGCGSCILYMMAMVAAMYAPSSS